MDDFRTSWVNGARACGYSDLAAGFHVMVDASSKRVGGFPITQPHAKRWVHGWVKSEETSRTA